MLYNRVQDRGDRHALTDYIRLRLLLPTWVFDAMLLSSFCQSLSPYIHPPSMLTPQPALPPSHPQDPTLDSRIHRPLPQSADVEFARPSRAPHLHPAPRYHGRVIRAQRYGGCSKGDEADVSVDGCSSSARDPLRQYLPQESIAGYPATEDYGVDLRLVLHLIGIGEAL